MPQIAQMSDAQALAFQHEQKILSPMSAVVVVVAAGNPRQTNIGRRLHLPGGIDDLVLAGQTAHAVVVVMMMADYAHIGGDLAFGVIVEVPIGVEGNDRVLFSRNGKEGMPPVMQQHGLCSFRVLQSGGQQLTAQRGQRFLLPQKGGAGLMKGFETSGTYRPEP